MNVSLCQTNEGVYHVTKADFFWRQSSYAARDWCASPHRCTCDRASPTSRWGRVFVRGGRRYPTDDVPPVEGRAAGPQQVFRGNVWAGDAREDCRSSSEAGCEADLRSRHKGTDQDSDAV